MKLFVPPQKSHKSPLPLIFQVTNLTLDLKLKSMNAGENKHLHK